ncbi:hypothetical protein [Halorussus litoreus]|uniref:hypothetical protein n=1 Tax=Halorussus litoreus TaxID=1710536 RepID=UPI000E27979C|nr:hypothetical protein [Halorussus litoreus]
MSIRLAAMASTLFLVTGALLVGDALHGSVVTAQYSVTSPAAVLRAVVGVVCIALGYRLKTPPSEYAAVPSAKSGSSSSESEDDGAPGPTEFDPEMSPLSDEEFERLDADDE